MKKYFLLWALVCPVLGFAAAPNCAIEEELPLKLMEQQLTRSFKILKKQNPPIYYLSYTYKEGEDALLGVAYDGVAVKRVTPVSSAEVMARAGSTKLDNTRALRGERENWELPVWSAPVPDPSDPKGFLTAWWKGTQQAAENAQRDFSRVQSNVRSMAAVRDQSDDFVFPPKETYCRTEKLQEIDLTQYEDMLKEASRLARGKDFVLTSSFSVSAEQGHRYFADSRGTRLKTPFSFFRMAYQFSGRVSGSSDDSRADHFSGFSLRFWTL